VLEKHKVALCVAESDELESPDVVTAPFRCYRLRKSEYSSEELDAIVSSMQQRGLTGDVFAYFKHEETPAGAIYATTVLKRLREGVDIA
jgi:hypothetical protein